MGIRTELIVNPPMPHCLLCTICKDLLEDPAEVSGCEHIYCRKCIEDWLVKNDTCPMDRQKTSKVSLKNMKTEVSDLKENLLGKEKDIQSLKDKEEKLQLELSGLKKALGAGLGMIRDVAAIE
ncbi:unnamed protein product [Cyprideis torosa]|uniref:Uncharacterized protein n=1 Tax=Cyprideis torosa TaxID=163714 RepID=A0A7R8WA27_9CRUS|nr:unnamed protein product [Cyprideis torosa]CAG0890441.1 unnamed protein product [Cyprideis torosa]